MTKNDMVLAIAEELNMKQIGVKEVVQKTLDKMTDGLEDKGRLELRNFGIFEVKTRKPRKARNPKTGQEVMVPERKVVVFTAGKVMQERVDGKN